MMKILIFGQLQVCNPFDFKLLVSFLTEEQKDEKNFELMCFCLNHYHVYS